MNRFDRYPLIALLLTTAIGFSLWQWIDGRAQNDVNCSAPYYVNEVLPNGARWELCWEHRSRDGIVLRDVYHTPVNGTRNRILTEASISQVHVPYDDNSARFHDITDDGFGDRNLANLTAAECPGGTLLRHADKNVLCQQIAPVGYAVRTAVEGAAENTQQRFALTLFSVSTSGEYNYIPVWRFDDDGSIEPIMGATGKLQRFDTGGPHSWPVRDNGIAGISHIHNYYWRLDFDLGESGSDDLVEELDVIPDDSGAGRFSTISTLETESARSIRPESMRTWRIRNSTVPTETVAAGGSASIAYQLDPFALNHRDVGPDFEPWTHNDLFVTKQDDCERYVSHNPQFEGCGTNITDFVNGESLVNADLVLWYGVTFHHIPRDEDEPYMHTHWDGFHIRAMNVGASSPPEPTITPLPTSTEVPIPTPTTSSAEDFPPVARFVASPLTGTIPFSVTLNAIDSSDSDGEIVDYRWALNDVATATGISITQQYTIAGNYPITLTVVDNDGLSDQTSQVVIAREFSTCDLGDVNCDGAVTITDAIFIVEQTQGRRIIIDHSSPPSTTTLLGPPCDVEMDGDCDTDDAVTIYECSIEVANQFCPKPPSATATAEEIAQFQALLEKLNSLYLPVTQ